MCFVKLVNFSPRAHVNCSFEHFLLCYSFGCTNIISSQELGLKKKEIDAIEFAFDVYDFNGNGQVDAFYVGDVIRACNQNPTLATIKEIGGGTTKGAKMLKKDDFFPLYKKCKDSKDQGGFHDFVEILKLYDKNADDTMLGCELFKLLTTLGEKLTKPEAKDLMKELCEPEDEDGFMPFKRKCTLLILSSFLNFFLYIIPELTIKFLLQLSLRGCALRRSRNFLQSLRRRKVSQSLFVIATY